MFQLPNTLFLKIKNLIMKNADYLLPSPTAIIRSIFELIAFTTTTVSIQLMRFNNLESIDTGLTSINY